MGGVTQRGRWVSQGTGRINSLVVYQNTGGTLPPHGNSLRVRSTARRGEQSSPEVTLRCNMEVQEQPITSPGRREIVPGTPQNKQIYYTRRFAT